MSASDIITLDNLREKLPQWSPDDESHLYAIVDMGSNGIRFSITSLAPPSTRLLKPIFSSRAPISLFDALTPSPSGPVFPAATIESVSSAVAHFHHLATAHGVPPSRIMILATEAMRRAANAGKMLEAIGKATGGLGVHILDPPVETLLGAVMGSRSGLVDVKGGALFLDLGGGSVQMTWVDTDTEGYEFQAAMAGESMPYGAAKLIRVLEESSADVKSMELDKLASGLQRVYAELSAKFPALKAIKSAYERGENALVDVYMCGGGFRGYGSILMHNDPISPYPIPSIATYSIDGSFFKQTETMRRVNQDFDGKIFGMSKRRRHQFPAIATVVEAFIAAVPNIGRVTFCGGSNKQGALMMKLPRQIRESNPLDVVANVGAKEKPIFDAILKTLSNGIPEEMKSSTSPTIFTTGLGSLFVREIWNRTGHDSDANASFALHDAVIRDSECPGLSHLARAVLALTVSARWSNGFGPVDVQIQQGLKGILDRRGADAFFLAQYIGALALVLATVIPVFPSDASAVAQAVRFKSQIMKTKGEKDKTLLMIDVSPESAKGIDLEDLADKVKKAIKKSGRKYALKVRTQVTALP